MLLEASSKLNSRAISLMRCLILALLAYSIDGLQYREIKAALNISDGKLISNLNILNSMGYLKKTEVELDNKKLDVYSLTNEGRKEMEKIARWMELLIKVGKEKC